MHRRMVLALVLVVSAVLASVSSLVDTDGNASAATRQVPYGADPTPTRQSRKVTTGSTYHTGKAQYAIDFNWGSEDADKDMDVIASEKGHVERSGCSGKLSRSGYGCWIEIEHPDGKRSMYAHLQEYGRIRSDASVCLGQQIAKMGKTGGQRFIHLHFHMTNGNNNLAQTTPYEFNNVYSRKLEGGAWGNCCGYSFWAYNSDGSEWKSCGYWECDGGPQ